MTRETPQRGSGNEQSNHDERRVCRMTGREEGLVGTYDVWLCRQSFRELAPEIGFEKYE